MEMQKQGNDYLKEISKIMRKDIVEQVFCAKSGHIGGSLSMTEIMTYLFFEYLNIDPKHPKMPNRDRFVLSKGHCSPALYAALAEKGYFEKSLLKTFRKTDSILEGHPSMKHVPGVEISTGSLGQGFSAAAGMAIAGKLDQLDYKVVALLGDGESQEGQIWECAMSCPKFQLDNLVAVLDYNGLQIDGNVKDIMDIAPIDEKFKAFRWNVITIDGHDFDEIRNAFAGADQTKGKPTMIIAKTIKGKGVSFMENQVTWHGVAPNQEEYDAALKEIEKL
jgi:transketolase